MTPEGLAWSGEEDAGRGRRSTRWEPHIHGASLTGALAPHPVLGGRPAALAPSPGTLPLTHSWNVPDSPGPEFPRGSAFRPWDGGIPVLFSPCDNGEHGRGHPAEPAQAAGSCELSLGGSGAAALQGTARTLCRPCPLPARPRACRGCVQLVARNRCLLATYGDKDSFLFL